MKRNDYLSALIYYLQRRREDRGAVVAVRTKDICGVDRRCGWALHRLMMWLVSRGYAKRHKQGVYLIEKEALERVLVALRERI